MRIPRRIGQGTGAGGINKLQKILDDIAADLKEQHTKITALAADVTAIRSKYNAALAKLDLDAGVTGTDYVATQGAAALTFTALEDRLTIGAAEEIEE